jgi:hypothetical protein
MLAKDSESRHSSLCYWEISNVLSSGRGRGGGDERTVSGKCTVCDIQEDCVERRIVKDDAMMKGVQISTMMQL